jgi:hypothetical protein
MYEPAVKCMIVTTVVTAAIYSIASTTFQPAVKSVYLHDGDSRNFANAPFQVFIAGGNNVTAMLK